jgi:glycosyltransferase involved in cell wall biosynthesis
MSTCAVMVARDEADIIEATVRHTLWHVDEMIVADHRSVDGTREILEQLPVVLRIVKERAFHGDNIWTMLATQARSRGHDWVLVVDADDIWHVTSTAALPISNYLDAAPADVECVSGYSYNHIPTARDNPDENNPVLRIHWRQRTPDARKVACRLRPGFRYAKHNGWYGDMQAPVSPGLTVRHFTIRSEEQLVRKIRNGLDGYSVEAGMPVGADNGWQQWKGLDDNQIRGQFRIRFSSSNPEVDRTLIEDPAPYAA